MGKNAACRVPRFRRLELTVGSALECSRSGALALHDARFVALLQRDLCFLVDGGSRSMNAGFSVTVSRLFNLGRLPRVSDTARTPRSQSTLEVGAF
jgi:hypothetical protein